VAEAEKALLQAMNGSSGGGSSGGGSSTVMFFGGHSLGGAMVQTLSQALDASGKSRTGG